MYAPTAFEHDTGQQFLLRAIIFRAVADIRAWETKCHQTGKYCNTLTMPQTMARDALDWLLGEREDDTRMTYRQCCAGLGIADPDDLADRIIAAFDRETIDLLDVPARQLPCGRWAVSPRPIITGQRSQPAAEAVSPVPVSA